MGNMSDIFAIMKIPGAEVDAGSMVWEVVSTTP